MRISDAARPRASSFSGTVALSDPKHMYASLSIVLQFFQWWYLVIMISMVALVSLYSFLLLVKMKCVVSGSFGGQLAFV